MRKIYSMKAALFLSVAGFLSNSLTAVPAYAQLERSDAPPPPTQLDNKQAAPAVPAPPGKRRLNQEIQITGEATWIDTGIDVNAGEHAVFTATGKLRYADAKEDNGPEGVARGFRDLLRSLPVNEAGRGAVIGRIGDKDTSQSFLIGAKRDVTAPVSGRLSVGINQTSSDTSTGTYKLQIEIYADEGAAARVVSKQVDKMPGIDNSLFSKIPRRIGDKEGNPGDMVNFVILGTETEMQRVFTTAGWVKVDTDVKNTILHGVIGSLSKESYLTMPMSPLYLFGRTQDYGWAHAEPISVVASRNHLRIWKAPFQVNGGTAWVGAATHDIGFERDQRNNGITHKIDPDIDLERNYVEKTLSSTGLVSEVMHFLPSSPMQEAKTATGGSFHSNGQVLILKLAAGAKDLSAEFSSAFCNVLQNENPDGGTWGPFSDYIQMPAAASSVSAKPATSAAALNSYRVLVIPGVLSSCQANTPAFAEGQSHLKDKHSTTVDFLQMPNDTSTANGRQIATYLRSAMAKDSKKFVIVGYSKGAPDVQEALANDAQAFKSLRKDIRKQLNTDHPDPLVPSFSLAAVSDSTTTSKMLLEAWKLLTAYDPRTDSQLLQEDAMLPGANILGVLRADHLAAALNYETSTDAQIRAFTDHNHYPRVALFEAAVRFAIDSVNQK